MYAAIKYVFLLILSLFPIRQETPAALQLIKKEGFVIEETADEWILARKSSKAAEVVEEQEERLWTIWGQPHDGAVISPAKKPQIVSEEELSDDEDAIVDPAVPEFTPPASSDWLDKAMLRSLRRKQHVDYNQEVVQTTEGPVKGSISGDVRSFLGVPYAGAPVGKHRWRQAPPAVKRSGIFDARAFGHHCWQIDSSLPSRVREVFLKMPTTPSEDCLNANIYTPTVARMSTDLLPVIVFIHGGCFSSGANSCPIYNPADVVRSFNAIFVVPNYRLNIFGYLASEDLAQEARNSESLHDRSFGNYAVQDIITLLRWIQANVAAFGGNPNLVTVMGQSAGAIMASYLQVVLAGEMFRSEPPLMHRVVLHSGSARTSPIRVLDERDQRVEPVYQELLSGAGCAGAKDRLACLRGVDAAVLALIGNNHKWDLMWMPTFDNVLLRGDPARLLLQGQVLPIPTLITSCRHDGSVFTLDYKLDTEKDYRDQLEISFGPREADRIAAQYPVERYQNDPYYAATAVITDALFKCPIMDYGARIQPFVPAVYYMSFHRRLWLADWLRKFGMIKDPGVFHGSELVIFFNPISYLTFGHAKQIRHLRRQIVKFAIVGIPILEDSSRNANSNAAAKRNAKSGQDTDGADIEFVEDAIDRSPHLQPLAAESQSGANTDAVAPKDNKQAESKQDVHQPVRLRKSGLIDRRCAFWEGWSPFLMETINQQQQNAADDSSLGLVLL